jgi:hypothetical protein
LRVCSPAAGTLRIYAITAWVSSSLNLPALVWDMTVSQRPSASAPLRIARKISPSDQCFNGPAGVRLEATTDPTRLATRQWQATLPTDDILHAAPQELSAEKMDGA